MEKLVLNFDEEEKEEEKIVLRQPDERSTKAKEAPASTSQLREPVEPMPIDARSYIINANKWYYVIPELKTLLYGDIKARLMKYSVADVCFLCDITGSMETYNAKINEALQTFVENVISMLGRTPRMAFIGFRDKEKKPQPPNMLLDQDARDNLVVKEFTTDLKKLQEEISTIMCYGGEDACEDLVKPMQRALNLDWRSDMLFVFMLLDAPTHGLAYHDASVSDGFPEDDKQQLLEKLCCHYRNKEINLVVIRCNNSIDKMLGIMRTYYDSEMNELAVIDLSEAKTKLMAQLSLDMSSHIATTLERSRVKHYRKFTKSLVEERLDPIPEVTMPRHFTGRVYSAFFSVQPAYDRIKYDYKIKVVDNGEKELTLSTAVIGTGTFSDCYYMHDKDNEDEKYVAKVPKFPAEKPEDLVGDIENNVFANHFRLSLGRITEKNILRVLPLMIIEVPTAISRQPFMKGSKFILAQKYLTGEFKKYNNNFGWKSQEVSQWNDIAQAFSHFTYEASIGALLLVDIQGVHDAKTLTITDPAIHSALYKDKFGHTNCSTLGILRFFNSHICNAYCKQLKLTHPAECLQDQLASIFAKREGDPNFAHLYGRFEAPYREWIASLRNFKSDLPPQPAPPPRQEPRSLVSSSYAAEASAPHEPHIIP